MTETNFERLAGAAAEAGWGEVEFYHRYSGRGMHGEHTRAVAAADAPGLAALVGLAAYNMGLEGVDPAELLDEVRALRKDSLGRNTVYY